MVMMVVLMTSPPVMTAPTVTSASTAPACTLGGFRARCVGDGLMALARDELADLEEREDARDSDARAPRTVLRRVSKRGFVARAAEKETRDSSDGGALDGELREVGAACEREVEVREAPEVVFGDVGHGLFFFLLSASRGVTNAAAALASACPVSSERTHVMRELGEHVRVKPRHEAESTLGFRRALKLCFRNRLAFGDMKRAVKRTPVARFADPGCLDEFLSASSGHLNLS